MSDIDPDALKNFGRQVDFGKTASDYATHRAGFPEAFFETLSQRNYIRNSQRAVDLGTGTGSLARGLAKRGLDVTGVDPAEALLHEARQLDTEAEVSATYVTAKAEDTGLPAQTTDLVTAGQCWHWFDRPRAAAECMRLLRPAGRIIIAHFDWLPLPGTLVAATEGLILRHNPAWAGAGGSGIYPAWLSDLARAGFAQLETGSFDVDQSYNHLAWRGRIRASAGISASLAPDAVAEFDAELAAMMECYFPGDPVKVPHRMWWVTGVKS